MAEQTFKKETAWGCVSDNFIGEDEITVTITLNEYRKLVSEVSRKDYDIEKEREKTREANKKADAYKARVEALIEKFNGVEAYDDGQPE